MYRSYTVLFEEDDCATATYRELPNNYIEVNNIEFAIDEGINIGGIPAPGKAQCSGFRSGLCQVKFNEFQPWSDYSILYTDYTTHTVVYGCDNFGAAALRFDWLWSLTRTPLEIGSAAHTSMKNTIWDVLSDKLPDYDPDTELRPTIQTTGSGCVYNSPYI